MYFQILKCQVFINRYFISFIINLAIHSSNKQQGKLPFKAAYFLPNFIWCKKFYLVKIINNAKCKIYILKLSKK